MKNYEWNPSTNALVETENPTHGSESITEAGYFAEFSSESEKNEGATIIVYATDAKDKPDFYIEILGQNSGIASLVAQDFPSLVITLNHIHPLLTLFGLDQFSASRIADHLDKQQLKSVTPQMQTP